MEVVPFLCTKRNKLKKGPGSADAKAHVTARKPLVKRFRLALRSPHKLKFVGDPKPSPLLGESEGAGSWREAVLLYHLDGEFGLVGLLVGMEFDKCLNEACHDSRTRLDAVLLFRLLLGVLAPHDRLFLRITAIVGKVEDIGALELVGA